MNGKLLGKNFLNVTSVNDLQFGKKFIQLIIRKKINLFFRKFTTKLARNSINY